MSSSSPWPVDPQLLVEQRDFLCALARGLVGDEHAAEDAVQEAWLAALERPPRSVGALRAWLAKVTGNAGRQWARSEGARRTREERAARPEAGSDQREAEREFELQERVGRALQMLPEPYRTTLFLRYYRDLTPGAIAEREEVPLQTVKTRLRRGLEHLRATLDVSYGNRREWTLALVPLLQPGSAAPAPPAGASAALTGVLGMKGLVAAAGVIVAVSAFAWVLRDPEPAPVQGPPEVALTEPVTPQDPSQGTASEPRPGIRSEVSAAPKDASLEASPAATERQAHVLVLDDRGLPVVGARVLAEDLEALTDRSGEALLPWPDGDLASQPLALAVTAEGYLREEALLTSPSMVVTLTHGATVSGRVVDASGLPMPGALLAALEPGLVPDFQRRGGEAMRTDASGEFRLDGLRAGRLRIWSSTGGLPRGCSRVLQLVPGAELAGIEVVLPAPNADNEIAGLVELPEGIDPEGVQVVYRVDTPEGSRANAVPIDLAGRFRFRIEGRGPHDVWATDRFAERDEEGSFFVGERPLAAWRGIVAEGVLPGTPDLILGFTRGRRVELDVRGVGGEPIDPFVLALVEGTGNDLRFESAWLQEAAPGASFVAPPEEFAVFIAAEGYEQRGFGPYTAATVPARLEVSLEARPMLTGRVTAEGRPIAGARVRAFEAPRPNWEIRHEGFLLRSHHTASMAATTDEQGRYATTLRRPADVWLVASAPGWADAVLGPLSLDLEGASGAAYDLKLSGGGTVEGRVLVPSDVDPTGWVVGASLGFPGGRRSVLGPAGTFRFEHLTPGPWWVGRLRGEGGTDVSGSEDPARWVANCTVAEDGTTIFELDFRELAECVVAGRLELGQGSTPGWQVELLVGEGGPLVDPPKVDGASAREEGLFELRADKPGAYSLFFYKEDDMGMAVGGYQVLHLEPGPTEVDVDLEMGTLRGRVEVDEEAPPFVVWLIEKPDGLILARVHFDADGELEETQVPAGKGTLRRPQPPLDENLVHWPVIGEIELRPGETARVGGR